jgi:hypothetical protein
VSLNRYAARRDANENELIACAESMGANIVIAGPLDFWVGHRGKWVPCEAKDPKGKLTPYQANFLQRCETFRLPVYVWRNVGDVLQSLGAK